jgi:protein MpaA
MRRRRALAAALAGIVCGVGLIVAAHALPSATATEPAPVGASADREPRETPDGFLGFAFTPRQPGNLLGRRGVAGRSAGGRPIYLRQYGDPAHEGELLVFGCIHGDECAAKDLQPLAPASGCPDPASEIYLVRNLNPDGHAAGTRLNGRGVDLTRNFAAGWRPIGVRGDPEHSGPRPFSEPETRLAARIVRRLRPEVTIWFHQHRAPRPLVRAWGRSVAEGRRYARLARLPFRRLRWPAGTGPRWQNRRLADGASFVVEMPRGPLADGRQELLERALVRTARRLARVGED